MHIRDFRIAREGKITRWWMAGDPVATAWFNALSGTFPRGEAFFIEAVKAHREGVPPELAEDIRAFIIQEVNHTREHLAFNRIASDAGYDMALIDRHVEEHLSQLEGRPPILDLAATMALEHYTAMMAHEFLAHPDHFKGADPAVEALWRWHAVEEIEHKAVAYDTWLHATREWSRWRRWRVKTLMMLVVTRNFIVDRIRDTLHLLAQDGLTGWRVKWRLFAFLLWKPGVLRRIFPAWAAYFLPGFHPWNVDDRALIAGFALAETLVEGGERVGHLGLTRPMASRRIVELLAQAILADRRNGEADLPPEEPLPRLADAILITDGLTPAELGRYVAMVGLSYVAGFLAFMLPSGVGVREGVLERFLAPEMAGRASSGPAVATLVVLVLRLFWTCAELAMAAVVYWLPRPRK